MGKTSLSFLLYFLWMSGFMRVCHTRKEHKLESQISLGSNPSSTTVSGILEKLTTFCKMRVLIKSTLHGHSVD